MADKNEDKLLDSNYDGIQEYDNDLPQWWVWLFIGTVIFGVIYVGYAHFGPGQSSAEQFTEEMNELAALRAQAASSAAHQVAHETVDLALLAKDASVVARGKVTFEQKCSPCHGPQGQGLIGPNLTDDYWIHGGASADIVRTIEEGVVEKGMVSWKALLPHDELFAVAAYIWTLRGTNPPNPKAPQGDLAKREA